MFSELNRIFAAVDQAFCTVAQAHPAEVVCGKGCSDCCNAAFDVSLVEAVNILAYFKRLSAEVQAQAMEAAGQAALVWEKAVGSGADLALVRVKCPLLAGDGSCLCYEARPVNCRTYGIPTEIEGKAHVCGLSGFTPGTSYPVVRLNAIQVALHDISVRLAGQAAGQRRFPVAAVILGDQLLNSLS